MHTLASARSGAVTRRLLLDLLHAANTAAPQRSQELETAASSAGGQLSGALAVDRQALFRHELLHSSMLIRGASGGC